MDFEMQTPFSKAFLTAVFVGIITSVLCLIYNSIFRAETGLAPTAIINVASIIFGVNLLFLLLGIIFYFMRQMRGTGELIYIIALVLLTALMSWKAEVVVRSANQEITSDFRGLLLGIVLIVGIGAAIAVPVLFHNKSFEKNVL